MARQRTVPDFFCIPGATPKCRIGIEIYVVMVYILIVSNGGGFPKPPYQIIGGVEMKPKNIQRVNARLGYTQNKWLDEESARTGISKSSLIQMAVEQYISQKQALNAMYDITALVDKLENIEKMVKDQNK